MFSFYMIAAHASSLTQARAGSLYPLSVADKRIYDTRFATQKAVALAEPNFISDLDTQLSTPVFFDTSL